VEYEQEYQENLRKMNQALSNSDNSPCLKKERISKKIGKILSVDIALIGGAAFHRHIRNKKSTVFVTSLSEIEKVLEEKQRLEIDEAEEQEIKQTLPACYHMFVVVFSKKASNTLPPIRSSNHRVKLEKENPLGVSPLY
jgi:hypothetical protein